MNATLTQKPAGEEAANLTQHGMVQVLELCGNLGSLRWQADDLENSVLRSAIEELQRPSLIVDLSHVEYGGAELLRCLLRLHEEVRNQGGELLLSGVSDEMAELLCLSNLDRVFTWYPTVETAMEALGQTQQSIK